MGRSAKLAKEHYDHRQQGNQAERKHRRSQHLTFGEFSSKFANVTKAAPWLAEPSIIASEPGSHPFPQAEAGIDAYALTHNETSTGVAMPIRRVTGADAGALVLVDATSEEQDRLKNALAESGVKI